MTPPTARDDGSATVGVAIVDTRGRLVEAAVQVVERDGVAGFSTRAVCGIVNVGAPTLYHHFGSADGLLSAAISAAFDQFLRAKLASTGVATDPVQALRDGWDGYVEFAATRPKLYAAMMARLLQGGRFPAADQGFAHLRGQIRELASAGALALPEDVAAQIAWASVNAAAMLYAVPVVDAKTPPSAEAVRSLREQAVATLCGRDVIPVARN